MRPACVQCGKPAIASSGGNNLCVDHAVAWQAVMNQQQANTAAMINMLKDQIDDTMGVPHTSARINVPTPTIHQGGHYTINDIRIDRSIVGAVSTAPVENMEVSMNNLQNQSEDGKLVADSIKALTEEVLENVAIGTELKNEIIESLAYLAGQAEAPAGNRQKSVIKSVLSTLGQTLNATASLVTIWAISSPLISNYLVNR